MCPDGSSHRSHSHSRSRGHGDDCRADDDDDDDEVDNVVCTPGSHRVGEHPGTCVVDDPALIPCTGATLVLLKALTAGNGPLDTIVCLFLGDAAAGANPANCPGGLVIGPVGTNLVGACLFVNNGVTHGDGVALPLPGADALPPLPVVGAPAIPTLDSLLSGSPSLGGTGSGSLLVG